MARRQGHFGGQILSAFRQAEGRTGRKGPEKVRRRSRKGKVERKLRTLDAEPRPQPSSDAQVRAMERRGPGLRICLGRLRADG